WYLNWIELPKYSGYNSAGRDLDSYTQNGIYVLKDVATTGDAMRIKLPFSNQRLWLENHGFKNFLDNRTMYLENGYNDPIPPPDPGLYMYVENLTDSRTTILEPLNSLYTNGIKVLHSSGSYDY